MYSEFRKWWLRTLYRLKLSGGRAMEQKSRSKMYHNCRIHCSNLMKNSLITGIPSIVKSKNFLRRILKIIVFIVSTFGFLYQASTFLEIYLEYPTIQDVAILYPDTLTAPAVTICNRNRLNRYRFCTAFNESCTYEFKTCDEFCTTYPKYCYGYCPDNYYLGIPNKDDPNSLNSTIEFLNTLGPDEYDLIKDCKIDEPRKDGIYCDYDVQTVYALSDGIPYRCFSVMSLNGNPEKHPLTITVTHQYNIKIDMRPEYYMKYDDLVQSYLLVHDPRSLVNPLLDGVPLIAGNKYKVHVTMQKTESLPPPYKSNCTDYLSKWMKNGGEGPLTKRECIETCKIRKAMVLYGCIDPRIAYPTNLTICNDTIATYDEITEGCRKTCNEACLSEEYTTTAEVLDDFATYYCTPGNINCKYSYAYIVINFNRMTITLLKYEPKFQSVEFFSYIGGYMGMWTGVSLISLFDLAEMILDMLIYPFAIWCRRLKSRARVRNMRIRKIQRKILCY